MKGVLGQIESILKLKVPIVSTTEELAYPTRGNMRYARRASDGEEGQGGRARDRRESGFVMDALPIMLTGVCERVEAIKVERIQDARIRRLPFQQKIGAGLTREQFQKKVDDGSVRHVGLAESVSMIADALGWKLDRITDDIQPKMATETVASEFLAVDPGYVCGIVQDGVGYKGDQPVITLHMEAYLGAPESYDSVEIVRLAGVQVEGGGRRARRHRHRVDRRQFAAEDPRGRARTPHHARHAAAVVLRRRAVAARRQDSDAASPQRRRLRKSPLREMPSSREASSTRPWVRSSARGPSPVPACPRPPAAA